MDVFETIKARRAVKHFDPEHELSAEETQTIFDMALQSPTSFNIQHWRFVHVTHPETRQAIRAAAWDQAQITEASMLLVLCADLNAWDKNPERYWQNAPREAQDILVPMIKPFYKDKTELQRDEAMRSVGIAAQSIMLTAKGLGYDSCPMIGFDQNAVAEIIKLPSDHTIGMIITIGKGIKPAWPKPGQLEQKAVVIENTFS